MKTEKLEFKHIAPYLAYGVKGFIVKDIYVNDVIDDEDYSYVIESGEVKIKGMTNKMSFQAESIFFSQGDGNKKRDGFVRFEDIKPILRPLSDLIKPCLDGGKVPIEEISELFGYNILWDEKYQLLAPITIESHYIILQLIEWHFDIYDLIRRGLAVDINRIEL